MDRESAITAINNILKLLPEEDQYWVWKQCAPKTPNTQERPRAVKKRLETIKKNAGVLYQECGVLQSEILSYLAVALDEMGRSEWQHRSGESYD
jgi:hypothetical protein